MRNWNALLIEQISRAFFTDEISMSEPSTCLACGTPIAQPTKGRRRRFCSDVCRRAQPRIQSHQPPLTACQICGVAVEQPPRGRRRKYCDDCIAQLRHRTPATKARKMARKMRRVA